MWPVAISQIATILRSVAEGEAPGEGDLADLMRPEQRHGWEAGEQELQTIDEAMRDHLCIAESDSGFARIIRPLA